MILDTSVWIAYLNLDDSQHNKARRIFASLDPSTRIIVPEYIYLEIVTVLAQRVGKVFSARFMDTITNNTGIQLLPSTPEFFQKVNQTFQKIQSKDISFVDAALVYLSKTYPVVTFDKKLQNEILKR